MEKNATLNLRVNADVKKRAENVLEQLGIPMSTAIDMYLNQIYLTGGIPFSVTLPKGPDHLNSDYMTKEELIKLLNESYTDYQNGHYQEASKMIEEFTNKVK